MVAGPTTVPCMHALCDVSLNSCFLTNTTLYLLSSSSCSLQFSFFYVLAFVLIVLGVFIYNLRLPKRAIKEAKEDKKESNEHSGREGMRERSAEGETIRRKRTEGFLISGLRGLLESQTYEMSGSEEFAARKTYRNSKSNTASRLASKLVDKMPEKWTPSHKDNVTQSHSRQDRDGSIKDMLEVKELVGGAKEGRPRGQSSSSGSDVASRSCYGSVGKHSSSSRTITAEISGSSLLESTP